MGIIDKKTAMSLAVGNVSPTMLTGLEGSGSGLGGLGKISKIAAILDAIQEAIEAYRELRVMLDLNDKGVTYFNVKAEEAFDVTQKKLDNEEKLLRLLIDRYKELRNVINPTVDQQIELRSVVSKIGKLVPEALEGMCNVWTVQEVNVEKALTGLEEQKKLVGDFSNMDATKLVKEFHEITMEIDNRRNELSKGRKNNSFFGGLLTEEMSDSEKKIGEDVLRKLEEKRKIILKLLTEAGLSRGKIITEINKMFRTSLIDWEQLSVGDLEFDQQKEAKSFVIDFLSRKLNLKADIATYTHTVKKQMEDLEKSLLTQVEKFQVMIQPENKSSLEDIKAQLSLIIKLKGDLDLLKGEPLKEKPQTQAVTSSLKQQINVEKLLLDNQMKLEEERLSLMEEGKNKRLALSALEHKKRENQIKQELASQQAMFDEAGEVMPEEVKAGFNRRMDQNDTTKIEQDRAIEKQYDDELKQRTASLTQFFLTEEERKRQAVKERYEEQRQWAKEQKIRGNLPEQQLGSFVLKVNEAEQREQYTRLLSELRDFETERENIIREWDAKVETAQGDDNLIARLEEEKQKALGALGGEELMQSEAWTGLFDHLDELTISQIDKLIGDVQMKMGEVQEALGVDNAKISPVDMKVIVGKLGEAKQQIATLNPFRALGDSMKEIFGKGADEAGDASEEVGEKWKKLGKATAGCFDFINDAVGSCSVLSDVLGESGQQTMGMIQGVVTAGIAMSSAIKGMEKGSVILAVISAALVAVNALASLFNGDKKQEKKIKRLQGQIDDLERSYNRLGTTIDNTYSEEVYGMMDEQNEKLREQQELIKQQIEAEDKKKKTDKGKIKDWENEIEDINEKIEENKRKQIEMLAGTDVQSAIDTFADALTEAYAKGEDGATALGATTKKVMANAVKEALKKKFLGDSINEAVNYLGNAMSDGVLSAEEQAKFEQMVQAGGENFTKAMGAYQNLLKEADGTLAEGVTGQLQAAMTEGTASQLVGLWNTTASDVRAIRDWLLTGTVTVPESPFNMTQMIELQNEIAVNTRVTAQSTTATMHELGRVNQHLESIDRNTRGYAGRGR